MIAHTDNAKNWYDRNYKFTIIIPALLLLFSVIYLIIFISNNGDVIYKDVSLRGGTTITVFDSKTDINILKEFIEKEFNDLSIRKISDLRTGEQKGFFIETGADAEKIKKALEDYLGYELNQDNSSIEFSGATLSEGFYNQLKLAIILAFLFMAIVVFFIFRKFMPCFAVVLSAFADITMTLAVVNIMGIQLSLGGIIAFLMLIGYSVDTDILLTSRMLKKGELKMNSVILDAFKTGITMTLTSIVAVAISLIIIYNYSETLRQIFLIVLIGLGFDILNTWFTNAPVLRWYLESKEAAK